MHKPVQSKSIFRTVYKPQQQQDAENPFLDPPFWRITFLDMPFSRKTFLDPSFSRTKMFHLSDHWQFIVPDCVCPLGADPLCVRGCEVSVGIGEDVSTLRRCMEGCGVHATQETTWDITCQSPDERGAICKSKSECLLNAKYCIYPVHR
jgi:hypothetical protein